MPFELEERPYADLVFHVLAHVESAVPASTYDREYVVFAERHLGPAGERSLGADATVLRAVATDHVRYARVQGLAWLFRDPEQAARAARHDLTQLAPRDVTDPALLARLCQAGPEVEVLRCAAELERDPHARLPRPSLDRSELTEALQQVLPAAPRLAEFRLGIVRALGRRGRVHAGEIWIGAPFDDAGPSLAHLAWQAAHEATVAELFARPESRAVPERTVEAMAIVLLGLRAERAGLASPHAAWLSHFEGSAGAVDLARLPEPLQACVRSLLDS